MSSWWDSASNTASTDWAAALAASMGEMSGAGGGGDQESLVAQVKDLCRSSPAVKEQWIEFTSKKGGGTKDPSRHTAELLLEFISTANTSAPVTGGAPATRASSTPAVNTDEGLVAQIKEMQRYDQTAKDQWMAFTDLKGGGKRDPNRYGAHELQEFLVGVSSGTNFQSQMAAMPGGLGEIIKTLQKKSQEFRALWAQYCNAQGGKYDPLKHDDASHLAFFEAISVMALGGSMGGGMGDAGGMVASALGPDNNPAKRARTDDGAGGDVKSQLVNQVKAFQKSGAEQKELWNQYAQAYLGGVFDPNRQEAAVLLEFCINHSVPEVPAGASAGGGGGFGSTGGWMDGLNLGSLLGASAPAAASPGAGAADPELAGLVARVKAFQKSSPENKEVWGAFCGATKDPSRHTAAFLTEFCQMYEM